MTNDAVWERNLLALREARRRTRLRGREKAFVSKRPTDNPNITTKDQNGRYTAYRANMPARPGDEHAAMVAAGLTLLDLKRAGHRYGTGELLIDRRTDRPCRLSRN